MKLDPRPLKPGDLTYQENARLMAHIAELTQGRDLGPKAIADLDEKEERPIFWVLLAIFIACTATSGDTLCFIFEFNILRLVTNISSL